MDTMNINPISPSLRQVYPAKVTGIELKKVLKQKYPHADFSVRCRQVKGGTEVTVWQRVA